MHAVAHGDCTYTVSESGLEADSGSEGVGRGSAPSGQKCD